jgi:hypothetical protein
MRATVARCCLSIAPRGAPKTQESEAMPYTIDHTDTFGGEANYCWVRRKTLDDKPRTDRALVREAKAFAGFTGLRCRVDNFGDTIQITPTGRGRLLQTVFVTWEESYTCALCGQRIDDGKPCGCGAR